MMMMRVSGKFDTSLEGKFREREKEETHKRISKRVCLSLSPKKKPNPLSSHFGAVIEAGGRLKRKKDTRQKEPTTFILYLRVNVFPFKTEENDEFLTVVRTVLSFA